MSLMQFFHILVARRLIIFGTLIVAVFAAVALCLLLPPKYPATARVLMDVVKPDPISGQVIGTSFIRGYTQTQTELITDYRVVGDVVDRLHWDRNAAFVEDYRENSDGMSDFRRYEAQKIIDNTDAKLVEGSNILEIVYKGRNPELAREVVTTLRAAYIEASLRFRTDDAGRSANWYVEQTSKAYAALASAESKKSEFERENGIVMAPGGAESETTKLEQMQSSLLAERSSMGMIAKNSVSTPAIVNFKMQLNSLDAAMVEASQKLGTSHPAYIGMVEQRKVLIQNLAKETAAAHADAMGTVNTDSMGVTSRLQAELAAQKIKVLTLKPKLDELAQLQREVDLRKVQYEKASERAADLKLEADLSETGLVSLGDAFVLGTPSFPNVPLFLALGFVAGSGLGLLIAITSELASRRIRGPEDLAQASKVAVLAVIKGSPPDKILHRAIRMFRREGGLATRT